MSFISDLGNFVGSGKLESLAGQIKDVSTTLGIKTSTTNSVTNKIDKAQNQFIGGYLGGTLSKNSDVIVIGVAVVAVVGLFLLARK